VLAHSAFGVQSGVAVAVIAYLAFVAVIALVELGAVSTKTETHIDVDLTVEESLDAEAIPVVHSVPDAPMPVLDDDVPIRRKHVSMSDITDGAVAAIGAGASAEVLRIVLHMRSTVGVALWWYAAFIALFYLLSRDRTDTEAAIDRVVTVFVWTAGVVVTSVLVWMVAYVTLKGLKEFSWSFFVEDLSKVGPLTPGGGAKHAIIGTLEQVAIATLIAVPIGILTAVYLHEVHGRLAQPVRFIVDAMSGLPSIVAGLLVFTVWVSGHGYSGLAGSIALVILMLPIMTRASEEILRTVPDTLREGALALGSPQWRLVQRVVLPTALSGLMTAALLAVARAIGETAPVLLTSLGSDSTNTNPTHGPQSDLPLFVWKLIFLPNETQKARAWTGAFILVFIVLILFVSARLIARRGLKKVGGTR
jgi:phosphate transport system permease protein